MKKLLFILTLFVCLNSFAQADFKMRSITTTVADADEMNSIPNSKLENGTRIYRADTKTIWIYDVSVWVDSGVGAVPSGGLSVADQAKLDNITITQGVDLDAIETLANSALQSVGFGELTGNPLDNTLLSDEFDKYLPLLGGDLQGDLGLSGFNLDEVGSLEIGGVVTTSIFQDNNDNFIISPNGNASNNFTFNRAVSEYRIGENRILTTLDLAGGGGTGTDDQTASEVPYANNGQTNVEGAIDNLYLNQIINDDLIASSEKHFLTPVVDVPFNIEHFENQNAGEEAKLSTTVITQDITITVPNLDTNRTALIEVVGATTGTFEAESDVWFKIEGEPEFQQSFSYTGNRTGAMYKLPYAAYSDGTNSVSITDALYSVSGAASAIGFTPVVPVVNVYNSPDAFSTTNETNALPSNFGLFSNIDPGNIFEIITDPDGTTNLAVRMLLTVANTQAFQAFVFEDDGSPIGTVGQLGLQPNTDYRFVFRIKNILGTPIQFIAPGTANGTIQDLVTGTNATTFTTYTSPIVTTDATGHINYVGLRPAFNQPNTAAEIVVSQLQIIEQ